MKHSFHVSAERLEPDHAILHIKAAPTLERVYNPSGKPPIYRCRHRAALQEAAQSIHGKAENQMQSLDSRLYFQNHLSKT